MRRREMERVLFLSMICKWKDKREMERVLFLSMICKWKDKRKVYRGDVKNH